MPIQRRFYPEDPEFSDYGRDPRIGPGWYILPLVGLGLMWVTIGTFLL